MNHCEPSAYSRWPIKVSAAEPACESAASTAKGSDMQSKQPRRKNQHEWGVVAQARNPYREFHYCPLCKKYREVTGSNSALFGKRQMRAVAQHLELYVPDSNVRFTL